jgi:hypothetical protein
MVETAITKNPQGVLLNTGYRREHHKSDDIKSDYFNNEDSKYTTNDYRNVAFKVSISITDPQLDIEEWVLQMVKAKGFESIEAIIPCLNLPIHKYMVIDLNEVQEVANPPNKMAFIRNAIILSKSNHVFYDPASPYIFTHKRLHRSIKLININLTSFYELD